MWVPKEITHDDNVSKISVVGLDMATQTGVADRMFRALADEGDQHPDDHHQRDQNLGAGAESRARSGGPADGPRGVRAGRSEPPDAKSRHRIQADAAATTAGRRRRWSSRLRNERWRS